MVVRPLVYTVAGAGEAGLLNQLKALQGEFSVSMALTGVTDTCQISQSVLDLGAAGEA
jgi:isopentenyl diphosphate isomerase/L-lactate dehydrogenase-like FMN-dependent dehydrogenase